MFLEMSSMKNNFMSIENNFTSFGGELNKPLFGHFKPIKPLKSLLSRFKAIKFILFWWNNISRLLVNLSRFFHRQNR